MATLNAGLTTRIVNGGSIRIYTSATAFDVLFNVINGTLTFSEPGRNVIPVNNNDLLDVAMMGDERPNTLSFTAKVGVATLVGTNNLYDAIKNVFTAGVLAAKKIEVRVPDYPGASTGTSYTFGKCYTPEGITYRATTSQEPDSLEISCTDLSPSVVKARY